MEAERKVKTVCRSCHGGCGVIAHGEDGRVVKVEGNIEACPFGAMQFDGEKEKAAKRDLCRERVNQGESPACTKACPTRCIFWGDPGALMERVVRERDCAG